VAIDLDSGTGLFDRLGRIGYLLNLINNRFGGSSADDFPTEVNDIIEEFDADTSNVIRGVVGGLADEFELFQSAPDSFRAVLQRVAQDMLVEMAHADNPLTAKTVPAALDELIRQMTDASETVDRSEPTIASLVDGPNTGAITGATQADPVVITAVAHGLADEDVVTITGIAGMTELNGRQFVINQTAANTFELVSEDGSGHTAYSSGGVWRANTGNPTMITSLLSGKGKTLENCLAEDLVLKITSTSTAGSETGTMSGEYLETSDKMRHDWPSGSGASKTITVRDPGSAGFLTNGDFDDFTANAPDNWTIDTGVAGTDVTDETSTVYRGGACLEFDGDGATLSAISQDLSALSLVSRTPYPVCVQVKCDVVPAAGVMVIDLYDGSAIISDDEGTANSLTVTLSAAHTTFEPYTAVFRLPEPVPATVKIRVRLSTAITGGSSAFVDDLIFGPAMTSMYTGGPYVSLIRGAVDPAKDDQWVTTVTNARAGAFQELFDKFYNNPDKLLPSATGAGETIADSLIG
jgi:hypothetical protein